jgi:hypothetical protein
MPIVSPQLDDLRFDVLTAQLRREIPLYTPEWTDHNDSDPGITFLQLFALLAEQIGFRLNRLPDKAYVEMLKLIGVRLRPAQPAQSLLAFYLTKPETAVAFAINEATRIKAKSGSPPPTFETIAPVDAVPAQIAALVTTSSDDLRDIEGTGAAIGSTEAQDTYIAARYDLQWDGRQPKLKNWPETPVRAWARPSDATHVNLWIGLAFNPLPSAGFLGQRVTITVQLDDDELPSALALADCNAGGVDVDALADSLGPAIEIVYYRPPQPGQTLGGWQDLRVIADGTAGLTRSGQIKLDIPLTIGPIPDNEWVDVRAAQTLTTEDLCAAASGTPPTPILGAIPHPLVGALKTPVTGTPTKVPVSGWIGIRFPDPPKTTAFRAITFNATRAIAATTVHNELLGSGTGRSDQTAQLVNRNVLADTLSLIVQDIADNEYHAWTRVEDFDTAGPDDRVYVLDPEAGLIYFGDGVRGRVPGLTARIVATSYRWASGASSELPVASITKGENLPTTVSDVTNVVPARGGRDAETLDDAKRRAPRELKTLGRAVTAGDFEVLAAQTPGVQIAKTIVIPLRRPYECEGVARAGVDMDRVAPGVVTLVCVPAGTGPFLAPTTGELRSVCQYLNQFRLVTTELYVAAPQYVRLFDLTITVVPKPGYTRTQLRELIATHLESFLHVLTGGPDGSGFPFGSTLPHAELVAQIFRVEGVERVESVTARFDGSAPDAVPVMHWRTERQAARSLVGCPTTSSEVDRIVLAADETVFVDTTTLDVIVQA